MKDTAKTYRAAVIGLGGMGQRADDSSYSTFVYPYAHASTYVAHPRTELVAGADLLEDRREEFRQRHGIDSVYADYREMLEKERPDVVSVPTRAPERAKVVIGVAEMGIVKGIYGEKPMATSLAECDAMVEACKKNNTVLMINHQRRGYDQFRKLRQMIEEGKLGELQHVTLRWGGSRLCTAGTHWFDLAMMMICDEVEWVQGWLSNPGDVDPGGMAMFMYKNGVRLLADGSNGMTVDPHLTVVGSEGYVIVLNNGAEFQWWSPDEKIGEGLRAKRQWPSGYTVRSSMINMVDDMLTAIETGGKPASSGDAARAVFEMIVSIHISHKQNGARIYFPVTELNYKVDTY